MHSLPVRIDARTKQRKHWKDSDFLQDEWKKKEKVLLRLATFYEKTDALFESDEKTEEALLEMRLPTRKKRRR